MGYQIEMYESRFDLETHFRNMEQEYISLEEIEVRNKSFHKFRPQETKMIQIEIEEEGTTSLMGNFVHFQPAKSKEGLTIAPAMINTSYPWKQHPLKICIKNEKEEIEGEDNIIFLNRERLLGHLRPLVSRTLSNHLESRKRNNKINEIGPTHPVRKKADRREKAREINLIIAEDGDQTIATVENKRKHGEGEEEEAETQPEAKKRAKKTRKPKIEEEIKEHQEEMEGVEQTEDNTQREEPEKEERQPLGKEEEWEKLKNDMEEIPEEIKEQITEENRQRWAKKTRIVKRDDGTKEQNQKWVEEDQEGRNEYWTKKGKEYMEERIKWGK